ncbi:hypothetical protein PFISCL1PPCAC_7656, partial [Pristionchus fissidentatus]
RRATILVVHACSRALGLLRIAALIRFVVSQRSHFVGRSAILSSFAVHLFRRFRRLRLLCRLLRRFHVRIRILLDLGLRRIQLDAPLLGHLFDAPIELVCFTIGNVQRLG